MDSQTSTKNCDCTIGAQETNCKGNHARNLSDAARYMLNTGGDIEMPRRVRTPSRGREPDDATISYIDPPLPARQFATYESSGMAQNEILNYTYFLRDKDESQVSQGATLPLRDTSGRGHRVPGGNLVEDSRFRAVNREPLTKFESLRIGDGNLRKVTIGGFQIDMDAAAQKAQEVIPLPPSRLPMIFMDPDLNFYHHFFNGIYEIVSYDDMMDIIREDPVDGKDSDFMMRVIEEILTVGYERSDTEAMGLIKRMIHSTFKLESTRHRNSSQNSKSLFVEANLWGFPYLESTMTCKEIDLRLWLKACHKNYETHWFNEFKSTRVPSFARSINPRSRSSQSSSKPSLGSISEMSDHGIADMLRDDSSTYSRSSRRSPGHRRKSRTSSSDSKAIQSWFHT